MDELEAQLSEVEDKIVVEQYKAQNQLKKEEVVEYLTHTIKQQPKLLIKNLIQKIVLYDDRFEIYYNYLNHMPPAEDDPDKTIRELSLSGCSDTSPLCPPQVKKRPFEVAFYLCRTNGTAHLSCFSKRGAQVCALRKPDELNAKQIQAENR